VLSHDFVEAALMRRGGWAAHMVPYLGGSYEEGPPTLTDMLVRDRRWCQGNLQHGKVVGSRGLHWISRVHMLIGIGHYFTAPMWGMLMLIGIAIPLFQEGIDFNALLHLSPSLYWRAQDEEQVVRLFGATMAVLLLPKVLGYLAMLLDPVDRRGCGGAFRAFVSMLVETVLAALMAPVVMYVQSRGVAEVLSGRDSGWDAQQRDDGGISWMALIRGYGGRGAELWWAGSVWCLHGHAGLGGIAVVGRVDGTGGDRHGAGHSGGRADLFAWARWLPAPLGPAGHPRGKHAAARACACRRAAPRSRRAAAAVLIGPWRRHNAART